MIAHILAIDQGTTSTRAMIFDCAGHCLIRAQQEVPQHYPRDGWVEQDPEDIWQSVLCVGRQALREADVAGIEVAGIGITNQRETAMIWNRKTGQPIHNAIVWQDRRTADLCTALKQQGHEPAITRATGLLLDPYFSATKIAWLLDHVEGARSQAQAGDLACGTVDSFLLWRLTGGRCHATDATNASRTLLFNLEQQCWDASLLRLFDIPAALLPEVKDCAADFGCSDPDLLGRALPIAGMAGDQQAAAIGQACFEPGMIKSTYGTGCFVLMNTGDQACFSTNRLLTTVAYRLDAKVCYALEGSIFAAGSTIQWLRDELGLIRDAAEAEALAATLESNHGVYLVPAFTGLGAPYWDPHARAAIYGLGRDCGRATIARAALESVVYQTYDLMGAMSRDSGTQIGTLRVDGGMASNSWMLQFLADILDIPVERPRITETTALGAACLAALQLGGYTSLSDIAQQWQRDRRFVPELSQLQRDALLQGWRRAVARTLED
jgi:glycerol kinase